MFLRFLVPLSPEHTFVCPGGDDGIRTHDPLLAGQVLSQLSYTPVFKGFAFVVCFLSLRFQVSP